MSTYSPKEVRDRWIRDLPRIFKPDLSRNRRLHRRRVEVSPLSRNNISRKLFPFIRDYGHVPCKLGSPANHHKNPILWIINNIINLVHTAFHLLIIHGYHGGEAIKHMLLDSFENSHISKRYSDVYNQGRTHLVIAWPLPWASSGPEMLAAQSNRISFIVLP